MKDFAVTIKVNWPVCWVWSQVISETVSAGATALLSPPAGCPLALLPTFFQWKLQFQMQEGQ